MPFQLVTVGYLALGNLIPFLAEKPLRNGYIALLMQHSKADLSIEGDGEGPYGIVDQSHADAEK